PGAGSVGSGPAPPGRLPWPTICVSPVRHEHDAAGPRSGIRIPDDGHSDSRSRRAAESSKISCFLMLVFLITVYKECSGVGRRFLGETVIVRHRRAVLGFTLVEVMFALAIIAIAI